MKKILDPKKLWTDSFVDGGVLSISFDKDDNFDSHCEVVKQMECTEAYWDGNGQLHLILKER